MNEIHLKNIIEDCRWSPTPDNCQPWTFEWKNNQLEIFHDHKLAEHPLNPNNITSVLMLGCLLETIQISASQFGYKTENEFHIVSHNDSVHWCTVRFQFSDCSPDPLTKFIKKRCTDRRIYQIKPKFLDLNSLKIQINKSQTHVSENITPELLNYIVETEQFLVDHHTILPSVMKWVRFSKKEALQTKDGFTWKNMLAKIWEVPALMLIRKKPGILKILRSSLKSQHRERTLLQLQSAQGFVCVSIPRLSQQPKSDLAQAGRCMQRCWLELTKNEFGVQPLSLSTLPILFRHNKSIDDFFKKNEPIIQAGDEILTKHFNIDNTQIPVWMFRFGSSTPLPEVLRTYRKGVESILKISL